MLTTCWPRAIRAVLLGWLWAITWTVSQAPFGKLRIGGEAAGGDMAEFRAVLETAYGVLHLGVAAMVGLQFQGVAFSIGDEPVVAVGVEDHQHHQKCEKMEEGNPLEDYLRFRR